jgi:hypothetical protein
MKDYIRDLLPGREWQIATFLLGFSLINFMIFGDLPQGMRILKSEPLLIGGIFFCIIGILGFVLTPRLAFVKILKKACLDLKKWRGVCANRWAIVLHGVDPMEYSKYSQNMILKQGIESLFTISTFEPWEIVYLLRKYIKQISNLTFKNDDEFFANGNFANWVSTFFPHFKDFEYFSQQPQKTASRLLVLQDENWKRRNKKIHFEIFKSLNGSLPCYVAIRPHIEKDIDFLTDHVVFDKRILVDYYDDSQTMIVTCDPDEVLKELLFKIQWHFDQHHDKKTFYLTLDDFITKYFGMKK